MMEVRQKLELIYTTYKDGEKIERRWEDVPKEERAVVQAILDKEEKEILERWRKEECLA